MSIRYWQLLWNVYWVVRLTILGILLATATALGAEHVPTGPAVGAAVPAIDVKDLNGKTQTLASLSGSKGLMLVFFRSADW